jgi:hypothetical protein
LGFAGLTDLGLSAIYAQNINGLLINNYSNTWLKLATNNIVRMTIAAAGEVGIGVTPYSGIDLDISRASAAAGGVWARVTNSTTTGYAALCLGETAATAATPFYIARYGSTHASQALGVDIWNGSNGGMRFATNNVVRVTIAATGGIDVAAALMANSLGWDNVQTVSTAGSSPISVTPTSSRIEVPGKGSGEDFTIALQAGSLPEGTILAVSYIGAAYDLTIDSDGADVILDAKEGCLFIKSSIGWLPLGGAA